jgi:hypothetical protein
VHVHLVQRRLGCRHPRRPRPVVAQARVDGVGDGEVDRRVRLLEGGVVVPVIRGRIGLRTRLPALTVTSGRTRRVNARLPALDVNATRVHPPSTWTSNVGPSA